MTKTGGNYCAGNNCLISASAPAKSLGVPALTSLLPRHTVFKCFGPAMVFAAGVSRHGVCRECSLRVAHDRMQIMGVMHFMRHQNWLVLGEGRVVNEPLAKSFSA